MHLTTLVVVGLELPLEGGVVLQALGETADCQLSLAVADALLDNHHMQVADASEYGLPVAVAAAGSTVPSVPVPFAVEPIMQLLQPSLDLNLEVKKMFALLSHGNTLNVLTFCKKTGTHNSRISNVYGKEFSR